MGGMGASDFYDRNEALERLGGDETLFAQVASLFQTESAAYCRALDAALAAADAAALRREAHTAKSMLATFSCEQGREQAMRLETLAASGCLDGAAPLVADVTGAIRRLAEALGKDTA